MRHLTKRFTTAFFVSMLSLTTGISFVFADEDPDTNWDSDDKDMPMFISDSNTGYIDSAIIQTQFRMRVDSGSNNMVPDLAEFFYGACGCARVVPNPPSNTPAPDGAVLNPSAPGPVGTVIPGAILTSPLIETSLDYQELSFDFEYALQRNMSVFAEVPIRFVDGEIFGHDQGLGDIRIGAKWGLLDQSSSHLTAQLRAYLPTGDSEKGLGTDHTSIEPGLLFSSRLNEQWTIASELRYWFPIDGTNGRGTPFESEDYAGEILRFGIGAGYDFNVSSQTRISPIVELVTWKFLGGQVLTSADGTPSKAAPMKVRGKIITNLKIGARASFGKQHSIFLGYGEPLTNFEFYDKIIRLELRTTY